MTMDDAAMSDPDATSVASAGDVQENNSLMSQLRVIEDQPLASRAAAFGQIHERLQRRLEGGDTPVSHA